MECINTSFPEFSNVIKTVSQEKRLEIVCMLSKVESLCVCDIMQKLAIPQNLVSHHLKVLKDIWLLETRRDAKNIYYSINAKKFNEFKDTMKYIFSL